MNKQKVSQIKKIINYDPSIKEHKRMLRRLKKEYQKLPKGRKDNLIEDLKKTFKTEDE